MQRVINLAAWNKWPSIVSWLRRWRINPFEYAVLETFQEKEIVGFSKPFFLFLGLEIPLHQDMPVVVASRTKSEKERSGQ